NAYVTGSTSSSDFPTTISAYRRKGSYDAFVLKLNPAGSELIYSTYLGGDSGVDSGLGIALDSSGAAYVTGYTFSDDFPVTPGAFQTTLIGNKNEPMVFVTKINPAGDGLEYSTYVGGTQKDYGYALAVDSGGNAYVAGASYSLDFPTTPG